MGFGFRRFSEARLYIKKRIVGKDMRKYVVRSVMFLFLILVFCNEKIQAKEKSKNVVYADQVYLSDQKPTKVLVSIRDNQGLMGFRIRVSYDEEVIQITELSRGSILDHGNFQDSFDQKKGEFDVLWSGTEDVKKSGTLFSFSVQSKGKQIQESSIQLTYSQEDTFNEKWEDVQLVCENIEIYWSEEKRRGNDASLNGATGKEKKELETEKINNIVDDILEQSSSKEIRHTFSDTMEEEDVPSYDGETDVIKYSKLTDGQRKIIAGIVLEKLQKKEKNIPEIDEMSEKDKVKIVKKMLRRLDEQEETQVIDVEGELKEKKQRSVNQEKEKSLKQTNKFIWQISVLWIILLLTVFVVIKHKKRKGVSKR